MRTDDPIERAARVATKSEGVNHRHGTVIVDRRGHVIVEGWNHYPRGSVRSMYSRLVQHSHGMIHAEQHALVRLRCLRHVQAPLEMYVVRIRKTNGCDPQLAMSYPCPKCMAMINSDARIRRIFYSADKVPQSSNGSSCVS
jgi:deoxycytidylate deaminase